MTNLACTNALLCNEGPEGALPIGRWSGELCNSVPHTFLYVNARAQHAAKSSLLRFVDEGCIFSTDIDSGLPRTALRRSPEGELDEALLNLHSCRTYRGLQP